MNEHANNNGQQSATASQPPSPQDASAPAGEKKPSVSFPVIVIGASLGGLPVIRSIMAGLPPDLGAAVFIVWHMSPDLRGILPDIINKVSSLPASNAADKEIIEPNHVYVAPPDHHLLIEGNTVRVTKGPRENRFRPAVDPLFRSAAYECGNRAIGIILTGALDDGTSGLWMIKNCGGIAIVQDPHDAEMPSMPQSAIRNVAVDYIIPAAEIPHLLISLVKEQITSVSHTTMKTDERTSIELRTAANENNSDENILGLGSLTEFTCPECHGVLTAIIEDNYKRFRCHTGHAFSTDSLLAALTENIEETLWNAIRSIKESTMLMNHIGDHFAEHNEAKLAALYFRKAKEADQRARQVRQVVTRHEQLTEDVVEEDKVPE